MSHHRWHGGETSRAQYGQAQTVRQPWTADGKADTLIAGRENGHAPWRTSSMWFYDREGVRFGHLRWRNIVGSVPEALQTVWKVHAVTATSSFRIQSSRHADESCHTATSATAMLRASSAPWGFHTACLVCGSKSS